MNHLVSQKESLEVQIKTSFVSLTVTKRKICALMVLLIMNLGHAVAHEDYYSVGDKEKTLIYITEEDRLIEDLDKLLKDNKINFCRTHVNNR